MNFSKFFKKITYFDVGLILIFISLVVGFFYFFYRKSDYVTIRVKVTDRDVLYARTDPKNWYAGRFEVGDVERDTLGRVITQIIDIESFDTSKDTKALYLDLKIKAVYDKRTKAYSAKGKNLVFGTSLKFNFSQVTFDALVTEIPNSDYQKNLRVGDVKVTALIRGINQVVDLRVDKNRNDDLISNVIEPQVLDRIKEGDKIMDSDGNTLAEVIDVQLRPAQRTTQTSGGDLLVKSDPYYKDAIFILSLRTKVYKGETFVFDDVPLKLGERLPLNFSYESIFPVVIGISDQ